MRFPALPKIAAGIFFGFIAFFFLLPGIVAAQTDQDSSGGTLYEKTDTSSYEPTAAEQGLLVTNMLLFEALSQLMCQLRGVTPLQAPGGCLVINPTTNKISLANTDDPTQFKPGGVFAFADTAISGLYPAPGQTANNIQQLANKFGITKKTYAQVDCEANPNDPSCQGQGFRSLNPLQDIYEKTRDIVYLLLVVVFIIVGVGIMVRFNIDPRTVMTIQNQIPKIIVGIILITFSYSIVGFMIDTMWVGTYFGINVLTEGVQPCDDGATLTSVATRNIINNPFGFTGDIFGPETGCFQGISGIPGLAGDIGGMMGVTISGIISEAAFGLDTAELKCGIGPLGDDDGTFQDCIGLAVNLFFRFLATIAAVLIAFVAIIVSLFRLWFSLIKAFILVLLDVILAPVWIFLGLIPGSTVGFGTWFRHLVAHLMVFPAAALLLTITVILARMPDVSPDQSIFVPPLIGNPNIGNGINILIAFGFILLIPELLEIIREAIKTSGSKHGGAVSAGIGVGVGVGASAIKGPIGTSMAAREYEVKDDKGHYDKRGFMKALGGKYFR